MEGLRSMVTVPVTLFHSLSTDPLDHPLRFSDEIGDATYTSRFMTRVLSPEDEEKNLDVLFDEQIEDTVFCDFARSITVKLVRKGLRYFMEAPSLQVLKELLGDRVVSSSVITSKPSGKTESLCFEIDPSQVVNVKERFFSDALKFVILEECELKCDNVIPEHGIELIRQPEFQSYQKNCIAKIFEDGKARSGNIMLPCERAKFLVGVYAACQVKKNCLLVVNNEFDSNQWVSQFKHWSTICSDQIGLYLYTHKDGLRDNVNVLITTYLLIKNSKELVNEVKHREWGVLLMDNVHEMHANAYRDVVNIIKCDFKLGFAVDISGLTEEGCDPWLTYMNSIGPTLYKARRITFVEGTNSNVQCFVVWCPMTENEKKVLGEINPNKIRTCEFLIQNHEERGDKILVIDNDSVALKFYANWFARPLINNDTSCIVKDSIIGCFNQSSISYQTLFLSEAQLDLKSPPLVNVIIQLSPTRSYHGIQLLMKVIKAKTAIVEGKQQSSSFFYSLVSDTKEMPPTKQLLDRFGYAYEVFKSPSLSVVGPISVSNEEYRMAGIIYDWDCNMCYENFTIFLLKS